MKDHTYHYHSQKSIPFSTLLIGFILLMVFGMKLLFLIPVAIFFYFATRCLGGGTSSRMVSVSRYDNDYTYGERKRKPHYDDEDDDITYL